MNYKILPLEATINRIINDKQVILLFLLSIFFIANTLIAEFIGVKIFSLDKMINLRDFSITIFGEKVTGLNLTAGAVLWPLVFIMTDVINEYFGLRVVKLLSYTAIIVIFYSFFIIYGAIYLPPNDWWQNESGLLMLRSGLVPDMNAAFTKIMGQGLWIIIGSMVAFLIGQIVDVTVFHKIKKWTGDKWVGLRATGSTLISQFLDSYVVILIAFWIGSDWNLSLVLAIGTVNYLYKFVVAIVLTPVIYLSHYVIDKFLGQDLAHQMKTSAQNG